MVERHYGLQAARGIAALLVVAHHIPWASRLIEPDGKTIITRLDFGGAGVTLFFVLSGYVMVHVVRHDEKFLWDRARRIYPGLWVALLLSAFAVWVLYGVFSVSWPPFVLWPVGKSYSHFVPYWTLHYEIAYYLLVWFAISVAKRPVIFIVVALLLSYAFADKPYVWTQMAFPTPKQFFLSNMNVLFLLGIAVGYVPPIKSPIIAASAVVIGCFLYFWEVLHGLTGLPNLPGVLTIGGPFPSLVRGLGAALVLMAALAWPARGRIGKVAAAIGDASYGIYLSHISIAMLVAWALKHTAITSLPFSSVMLLVAVVTVPLAYGFGKIEWSAQSRIKRLSAHIWKHQRELPISLTDTESILEPLPD